MNIKRKIDLISDLDMGIEQLAMLALTILGEKPAVDIDLYSHNNIDQYKLVTLLGSMGIPAYATKLPNNKNKNHVSTTCVSNSSDDATLLVSLVEIRNLSSNGVSDSFHIAYGALMGYPLSAIEGFISGEALLEKYLLDQDPLLVFVPSKHNFAKEIQTVVRWRKALKEHAPKILKRLDNNIIVKAN